MGITLANPLVVAACSLSGRLEQVKRIEAAGAGALVIKSLFEEQILREMGELEEALEAGSERFGESVTYFPKVQHAGAREHLRWIETIRAAVKMPLIGSLNAGSPGVWVDYARQMSETGVDGLELNVYSIPADLNRTAAEVEAKLFEIVEAVKNASRLPIAVKISPYYTSLGNVVRELEKRGARAVVLFNRFLQPDIDPVKETLDSEMTMSTAPESRVPLRWIALLHGRVGLDLAAGTGAHTTRDVEGFLLAGATVVQMASALYQHGIELIPSLLGGLDRWMNNKRYARIGDFRGKMSQGSYAGDPSAFERAQYTSFLLAQTRVPGSRRARRST
jgi:dihydroorotate dehydrogenase (fumarate)